MKNAKFGSDEEFYDVEFVDVPTPSDPPCTPGDLAEGESF